MRHKVRTLQNILHRRTVFVLKAVAFFLLFQNCGEMAPLKLNIDTQYLLVQPMAEANFAWTTEFPESLSIQDGIVDKWTTAYGGDAPLFPPVKSSGDGLDYARSGKQITTALGVPFVSLESGTALETASGAGALLTSDSYTVLVVAESVQVDRAQNAVRLFELVPADDSAGDTLSVDIVFDGTNTFAVINYASSSTDIAHRRVKLDTDSSVGAGSLRSPDDKPIAIAARFSVKSQKIQIAVNGLIAKEVISVEGNPSANMKKVARRFRLRSNTYAVAGSAYIGEAAIYKRELDDATLAEYSGRLHTRWVNGFSVEPIDPIDPGGTPTPTPTPTQLTGAQLYTQNCSGCHGPLATSSKHGVSKAQIDNAIATRPQMAFLSFLTSAERQKISDALK